METAFDKNQGLKTWIFYIICNVLGKHLTDIGNIVRKPNISHRCSKCVEAECGVWEMNVVCLYRRKRLKYESEIKRDFWVKSVFLINLHVYLAGGAFDAWQTKKVDSFGSKVIRLHIGEERQTGMNKWSRTRTGNLSYFLSSQAAICHSQVSSQ